ncbi:Gcn1p Ecym_2344 [Eremothecium cymbalariae DBVPG|uniref:eIF-2-alpha kinase activator GCN1 n=1 Tax=Eremothecium cymbalariae (strain CBS 270.75 / DBVPG 7215 / KCTC 17166 / NRRL Y-17582) TaxID=931890 RepID=G8JQ77_ERECY|nr:Hypothetical protein Ecym_2344 [Eremothecium cymbalariae DBVPG\
MSTWHDIEPILDRLCHDSLLSVRLPVLEKIHSWLIHGNISDYSQLDHISSCLLKTYAIYQDPKSKTLVKSIFQEILGLEPQFFDVYLNYIEDQVLRAVVGSKSVADYLNLFDWVNCFLVLCIDDNANVRIGTNVQKLVQLHCVISSGIEAALDCQEEIKWDSIKQNQRRRRIRLSVLQSSSKALFKPFKLSGDTKFMEIICGVLLDENVKLKLPHSGVIILMGALIKVLLQLLPIRPTFYGIFKEKFLTKYLEYTSTEVLLGKNPPSPFCIEVALSQFIHEFVDHSILSTYIIPSVEKCNLRSPTQSFKVSAELYTALDSQKIDLIKVFTETKLMSQTLSSFKSSKEPIRDAALNSMLVILENINKENYSVSSLELFLDEIFKSLKSNLNIEYKSMVARTMKKVPTFSNSVSNTLLHALSPYVVKETNENVLFQLLDAFFAHLNATSPPDEALIKIVRNGFHDKKLPIRKIWFTSYLSNAAQLSKFLISTFGPEVLEFAKQTFCTPLKGLPIGVLGVMEFWNRIHQLGMNEIEAKFVTTIEEIIANSSENSFGRAWLYITLSTQLESSDRLRAVDLLGALYQSYPGLLSTSIINTLKQMCSTKNSERILNCISYRYLSPVVISLSQQIEDIETLKNTLVDLLIVTEYEEFNIKNGWASLVLNAKQDPSEIVSEYALKIIDNANEIMLNKDLYNSKLADAAAKSICYSCFINPKRILPLIIEILQKDLDLNNFPTLTEQDLAIWNGKDGELVIDIVELNNNKKVMNKNSKDYETLKWEESIRRNQRSKQGIHKKWNKEEQALVDAQLAKESAIRFNISACHLAINRSVQIITTLTDDAIQVDNGADEWYPVAVTKVLDALQHRSFVTLMGEIGVQTFLKMSVLTATGLGSSKFFLGVAVLRSYKVDKLPSELTQYPLVDLISSVLFKAKFVSDKKTFDSITLAYCLPLLIKVMEEGQRVAMENINKPTTRSEFSEEEKEEEHLLLALEIISSHAEAFEDPSVPRRRIISVLLLLLALPSKAKLAKDCFLALCQHISVSPAKSDIDLILSNLMSPNRFVRATILEAIDNEFELQSFMHNSPEIFICTQDEEVSNSETARFIWEYNHFEINEDFPTMLFDFFGQNDIGICSFVAKAFAEAVASVQASNKAAFDKLLDQLMEFYILKARPAEDISDEFGLVVISAAEQKDPWHERNTTAIAFKHMSPLFKDSRQVIKFIHFAIQSGALGDQDPVVRQGMKEAGIEIINEHGAENVEELIPIFEQPLTSESEVRIKENVIILYGSLARHLETADPRVDIIVNRLLATLNTPSEEVQQAVSVCISPLVTLFRDEVGEKFETLTNTLLDSISPVYIRRGAAWGIAGLTKGYGISALAKFDIIRNLIEASEDKKDPKRRESVAYAFECLSKSLGKLFEPYVIRVLPNILKNLGDSVPDVRDSTAEATKSILSQTTSYGVKKLIPVAVSNLEDVSWRTKRGSVELLGNMAYLDPTQLSASLSTIVPEIVSVLNDSHKEVRKAAEHSLKRFGEVIRNPEIQALVPTLIKAIGDPTSHTESALDALIKTQFCHYIDGPSLALIIHVIHRGMRDRSANTKRKACKIVGNMAILVDKKDLIPYLQQLIDEVEVAMVDPVPQTRATAARALGALVERLGEDQFRDLIPRLLDTLSDDSKSGDRLGSAQALAEVINGLGLSKLEELLPAILNGVTHFRPYVREGFMPLLLFIPICFGAQFAPYINQIIQPILSGLADTDENIRDIALKAGKLIVTNYATKAIDLLLPELEKGMLDENERIRLSSVQLAGDLLFQITGTSSHNEFVEEQSDEGMEVSNQLVDVLGKERRDRILSSLFFCRNDSSGIVRSTTLDIWKSLVPNTPRTIKEMLPTLTNIIVVNLASPSSILRRLAAQTLGDLVRRVGTNALSQLLPTLEESLNASIDSNSRQGICIALGELIESSNTAPLLEFQDIIVNIIRNTLVDSDEMVRESAALSFDAYQNAVGNQAIDNIIPYLLNILESSNNSEYALSALQGIISTKSEIIFPILIPSLLSPPIDAFKARALGSLAEVAGTALYKRLSSILNALVNTLVNEDLDYDTKCSIEIAIDRVLASVSSEDGIYPLMQQIMALLKSEDMEKRIVILNQLPNFFENTTLDYSVYTPDIVAQAILSLDNKDSRIVEVNFQMLSTLLKKQDKMMLEKLVQPAKQSLHLTGTEGEDLAAFTLPNGPNCVLPIFLQGLVYGSSDEREASALAIADVVSKTPSANLRPFVTVITGPLIRVVGERFSSDIKAAILYALNILFSKVPQFLKPFIPQLQRTFVRSLSDASNETLRLRAAKALGTLIQYQPRVDPLIVELSSTAHQSKDPGVRTATLKALLEVVSRAGNKLSDASKKTIINLVEQEILSADNKLAIAYARLIGALSEILSADEACNILNEKVLQSNLDGEFGKFGILTLNSFLKDAPMHIFTNDLTNKVVEYLVEVTSSKDPYLSDNGLLAVGKILLLEGERKSPTSKVTSEEPFSLGKENIEKLISQLNKCMLQPPSNSLDTRRMTLVVIRTLARFKYDECIAPYLDTLGPSTFSCLRDIIIPIKLCSEKAFLAMFKLVEEKDMTTFNNWLNNLTADPVQNSLGAAIPVRSISDYTKRVGGRLANVERERIAAGGDAEAMFSDRFEDETEIWAVGGVDLNSSDI